MLFIKKKCGWKSIVYLANSEEIIIYTSYDIEKINQVLSNSDILLLIFLNIPYSIILVSLVYFKLNSNLIYIILTMNYRIVCKSLFTFNSF